jgi:tight adherence protein B
MTPLVLTVLLSALFLGLFLLVLVLVLPPTNNGGRKRLKQIRWFGDQSAPREADGVAEQAVAHAQSVLSWADRTIETRANTDRLAVQLERAGIALRPQEWLLIWAGVAATSIIAGLVFLPWWAGLPIGALVGVGGPWLVRVYLAKLRIGKFAEQLPDALQMIVGSLQSGFSLPQALDTLVREAPAPISTEFGRVLAETQLGSELEDALERAAERTKSADLECMVMAIRIQHEVGGSLAEVLTTAVATMRDRFRMHRQVRALSAEGRLSAYVLIGLPISIGAYMFVFNPDYVRPLYTEFWGIVMLAAGVLMLCAGAFWMSRLIKVEV